MVTAPVRPARGNRGAYVTFRALPTRWRDNDIYGHMNNVVHYELIDTAVSGWLVEQGLLDPGRSTEIGVVVETGCRYHAEIGFPDIIHAGLRISRLGTSSVRFEIGLFRNDEDLAAAEGFFVQVQIARDTRRPVPLDARARAALSRLHV